VHLSPVMHVVHPLTPLGRRTVAPEDRTEPDHHPRRHEGGSVQVSAAPGDSVFSRRRHATAVRTAGSSPAPAAPSPQRIRTRRATHPPPGTSSARAAAARRPSTPWACDDASRRRHTGRRPSRKGIAPRAASRARSRPGMVGGPLHPRCPVPTPRHPRPLRAALGPPLPSVPPAQAEGTRECRWIDSCADRRVCVQRDLAVVGPHDRIVPYARRRAVACRRRCAEVHPQLRQRPLESSCRVHSEPHLSRCGVTRRSGAYGPSLSGPGGRRLGAVP
jgi:hypothetical protein